MKKKLIGIMNGQFYIKDENKEFILQDKNTYLPIVLNEIDKKLEELPSLKNISHIIFESIKVAFGINSVFKPPSESSIVPQNDELYLYLVNYVQNNEIYVSKLQKHIQRNKDLSEGYKKYKIKNEVFESYQKNKY